MNKLVVNFVHDRRINSFPKLHFLLFLNQNPHLSGSPQQLAERLYVEAPLVEKIITELQTVGLLKGEQDDYILPDEPNLKASLQDLAQTFEHPLARQELLKEVKRSPCF